jgi:hypothetical protein
MHHPDAMPRNGDDGANNGIIVLFDALISVLGSGIKEVRCLRRSMSPLAAH